MSGSEASPPPTVTVRRAAEHDLAALVLLLERYFVEGEVGHRDRPDATRKQVVAGSPGFVIAECGELLAGCMLIRELKSIPHAAEGKRMFVAPEFRGHGMAGRILEAAEAEASAAGYEWLYLDSKENFAAAIAMYRRRGYVDCPRFHDDREATVFLRKRLERQVQPHRSAS